ncbi:MAG TPA: hypothetical protein VLF17_02845 [Candidatus Nitrosotenuis sp.]|nr:hypothetical protein [Candidatus Nitrosotenuis sp.]
MEFSEEQVKDALELRDRITAQIEKHREEIEILERNLVLINSVLKQQSFTKASSLKDSSAKPRSSDYTIPLKKNTDGSLIANAYVTPEQVSIIVEDGIELKEDSHPFKSFFLERIIGEMKRKDEAEFEKGDIGENAIINCLVNKDGSLLREIIIKNYRQKERINEIVSTAAWSFSKMIENSK